MIALCSIADRCVRGINVLGRPCSVDRPGRLRGIRLAFPADGRHYPLPYAHSGNGTRDSSLKGQHDEKDNRI